MNKILAVAGVVIRELIRRKDFYVLFILTALITLLAGGSNLLGAGGTVRYLKEICLLLIWIAGLVIAITTAARQIPAEKESRTIFPLLAKPISRAQVLLGKFAGCWLATGVALLVFYLFFAMVGVSGDRPLPLISYLQAVWLHWLMLGIVIALTLLGSLVLSAPGPNVTLIFIACIGILLVGRHLNLVATQLTEPAGTIVSAVYFAIPHLEFFDVRDLIIHDWPAIAWTDVALATLYGLAYTAFFLLAGCLVFRRKALN